MFVAPQIVQIRQYTGQESRGYIALVGTGDVIRLSRVGGFSDSLNHFGYFALDMGPNR